MNIKIGKYQLYTTNEFRWWVFRKWKRDGERRYLGEILDWTLHFMKLGVHKWVDGRTNKETLWEKMHRCIELGREKERARIMEEIDAVRLAHPGEEKVPVDEILKRL